MRIISETESARLIDWELAMGAARDALTSAASTGVMFPAVIGHGVAAQNRFSIKSGVMPGVAGLKVGSYWPGNRELGLPRHNSTILLLDEHTGRIQLIVQAGLANAYRTAAANAVACSRLARDDARTLAVFGAGNQALYDILAVRQVRPIDRILVVSDRVDALLSELAARGVEAAQTTAEQACACADIITTVTPSRRPLFEAGWVKPGTHISAMGADGPGKQELPPALLATARLYCDLPSQSVQLGEFQSIADKCASGQIELTAIGDVLLGRSPGRRTADEITIFDSSGIALQDLALALRLAERAGVEV